MHYREIQILKDKEKRSSKVYVIKLPDFLVVLEEDSWWISLALLRSENER